MSKISQFEFFRMDTKGSSAEISYPNIFFILDNFEEVRCVPVVFC